MLISLFARLVVGYPSCVLYDVVLSLFDVLGNAPIVFVVEEQCQKEEKDVAKGKSETRERKEKDE